MHSCSNMLPPPPSPPYSSPFLFSLSSSSVLTAPSMCLSLRLCLAFASARLNTQLHRQPYLSISCAWYSEHTVRGKGVGVERCWCNESNHFVGVAPVNDYVFKNLPLEIYYWSFNLEWNGNCLSVLYWWWTSKSKCGSNVNSGVKPNRLTRSSTINRWGYSHSEDFLSGTRLHFVWLSLVCLQVVSLWTNFPVRRL